MPLKFFENEAQLTGRVRISKDGITGKGDMGFKTAYMKSNLFKFTRWDIKADTSSFNLKNIYRKEGDDPLALSTEGVTADISFKERKGSLTLIYLKKLSSRLTYFTVKWTSFIGKWMAQLLIWKKVKPLLFKLMESKSQISFHIIQIKKKIKL